MGENKTKKHKRKQTNSGLEKHMEWEYVCGQGHACVHDSNNQGMAGNLEWPGWAKKPFLHQK